MLAAVEKEVASQLHSTETSGKKDADQHRGLGGSGQKSALLLKGEKRQEKGVIRANEILTNKGGK